MKDDGKE